ncbi:sortase [Actinokineospora auranticolor]|uniref:Sortase family protein n=1 Tax=Actinokineospora auranticolor TaxID=155976 RepID=A0A2S6GYH0_9PSEU|nr:class F sortase [Actinokineospora auranticolor]PPK70292.1 sortase family protein [Actinokineospora auranticolor]
MARRGSRLAPPVTAGGAGLLIVLAAGLAVAAPIPVPGAALPAETGLAVARVRQAATESRAALESLRVQIRPPAPSGTPTMQAPTTQAPTTQAPVAQEPAAEQPARQPAGQRPGTLRLARGGTAALVRRELTADATLPVPSGVREATWWGAGLDAAEGATVFAGHVNWKGQTGPFAELWSAAVGDPVSVVDAQGRAFRYRVTRVETVDKHSLPTQAEEFFGQSGPHRVVLVTCGGRWVGGTDGYAANRVVIAQPE